MATPRFLAMVERRVLAKDRVDFIDSLSARRLAAKQRHVNFWVFEHLTDSGRFVEFTETSPGADVASVEGGAVPLWREVQDV